jgi:hypothetical protein
LRRYGDRHRSRVSEIGQRDKVRFVNGYTSLAFGTRSKAEIDLLVFTCLIEARAIDPEAPVYNIARALNITPTRVRSLIFNWQLRTTSKENDLRPDLVAALKKTRFGSDGIQRLQRNDVLPVRKDDAADS